MHRYKSFNRKNITIVVIVTFFIACYLCGRLFYLMVAASENYAIKARQLHERERSIKAERGTIYDRNGTIIAANKPVSTISVIHNQIKDPEGVIKALSDALNLSEETVRKRVEKYSSIERIKSNVDKETADYIRNLSLAGVMVDEDYKRFYPYGSLASKVIGFTGSDNQGIIGLEVEYDSYLQGVNGTILTLTTAHGIEIDGAAENRIEPIPGNSIHLSLDVNIQKYAEQAATKVMEAKGANNVSLIVLNPQNGEIYAMANVPEFDLNNPYSFSEELKQKYEGVTLSSTEKTNILNNMWRNPSISDTYEPGSTFKIVTATAALEEKVVRLTDRFFCPGFKIVEDRRIRCHKAGGHGSEDFVQGIKNSCNPVFMEIGARVGATKFYEYFDRLGLSNKTGVDLPGEANSIKHKLDKVGVVELATMSFGQSFQITPLQLLTAASAIVNGGTLVTPHFGVNIQNAEGTVIKELTFKTTDSVISKETSETMKMLLEAVVADGTGKRAYIPGFRIGGKTATSEKLPRRSGKYISSFIGFAPANNPQVMAIVLIDEPEGIYYGGTIAAPVISEVFDNILPYIGIEPAYSEKELEEYNIGKFEVPSFIGLTKAEVVKKLKEYSFGQVTYLGEGEIVKEQFPLEGDMIKQNSDLILYLE
ncbi:MAG TPA: peptidoglycan glycosyltransferase [Lachnoclostridium phytofermentans]|uniref:Peptidoglycan glycosyltransferase n=1 Tax=Lachnoclostridium phytofermentans TaxID=66219 RepID=A0A3D2X1N3_9FIRM|nr:penicillin-binding transpeptidase domain-containing protein [Lachnoclostridium sp.]HCL01022.1 peptidoglycan glycosyltransferase [Lachnoclostridium phytofermentans]